VSGSGCQLVDDGGVIGLSAQTVEQDGFIQANSIGTHRGVIELAASGQLTLGAGSQTIANGGEIFASGSTVESKRFGSGRHRAKSKWDYQADRHRHTQPER